MSEITAKGFLKTAKCRIKRRHFQLGGFRNRRRIFGGSLERVDQFPRLTARRKLSHGRREFGGYSCNRAIGKQNDERIRNERDADKREKDYNADFHCVYLAQRQTAINEPTLRVVLLSVSS